MNVAELEELFTTYPKEIKVQDIKIGDILCLCTLAHYSQVPDKQCTYKVLSIESIDSKYTAVRYQDVCEIRKLSDCGKYTNSETWANDVRHVLVRREI